jgi:hypothetical protein
MSLAPATFSFPAGNRESKADEEIDLIKSFPDDTTCAQTLGPLLRADDAILRRKPEDPSGTQPSGWVSAC